MSSRGAGLVALAGALVAGLAALGVALSDGPHLGADALDPWLVVYALGLAVVLGVTPFALQAHRARRADYEALDWEPALIGWGAIASGGLLVFVGAGLLVGFEPESSSGALAIVGAGECGLVVVGLLALVLSTG